MSLFITCAEQSTCSYASVLSAALILLSLSVNCHGLDVPLQSRETGCNWCPVVSLVWPFHCRAIHCKLPNVILLRTFFNPIRFPN